MRSRMSISIDRISLLIPILLLTEGHWSHTVAWVVAAALHECGHLLTARLLHIPIDSLHISILGARLELRDFLLSYSQEWLLCAAGPFSSFLAAAIAGLLSRAHGIGLLAHFAMISLALGMINLLPIGWLDGGRMFRAMCLSCLPQRAADIILRLVSLLFFLLLWTASVYLLLRVGNSLSLFLFSFSLFWRFFLSKRG